MASVRNILAETGHADTTPVEAQGNSRYFLGDAIGLLVIAKLRDVCMQVYCIGCLCVCMYCLFLISFVKLFVSYRFHVCLFISPSFARFSNDNKFFFHFGKPTSTIITFRLYSIHCSHSMITYYLQLLLQHVMVRNGSSWDTLKNYLSANTVCGVCYLSQPSDH